VIDRPPSNAASAEDELADWLIAHDRGLTQGEALAFDRWLAASPAHALAWAEVAPMWESFDHADRNAQLGTMLDEARTARALSVGRAMRRRGAIAGAGVGLSALALAWIVAMPRQPKPDPDAVIAEQTFATDHRPASYRLADGTQVTLDAGSTLSFVERGHDRMASLTEGRAFLTVRHDPARPFRVTAGGASITDIGTRFGIASERGALVVTLVSGKVAIADPATGDALVTLAPGQQFRRVGNKPGAVAPVDPETALSWREGYLEFDRTPVAVAIAEMNRYTANPLRIGDPEVGRILVSGRFKSDDPERFVRVLAFTEPVQLEIDDQGRQTIRLR